MKNQWHPGFSAALHLELKANREDLVFETEHNLSKKPLQIDMLIIKNNKNVSIQNKIGAIFKRYNLIEYKSPDDGMGVDTFYKVIAYACLYKVSADRENAYLANDITLTLIRQRYPVKLINYLKQNGCSVHEVSPGIYYVTGKIIFDTQIIVTKKLQRNEHIWLHSLQKDISQDAYQQLLFTVDGLDFKEREQYGEAILEIVSNANDTNIERWKEESSMTCPTLERIMAPELNAQHLKGKLEGKVLAYADMGLSISEIAIKCSLSEEKVEEILIQNEAD